MSKLSVATLGSGCFWCVEAIFQSLKGVMTVESGYSGGVTLNPTYKDIATGTTGHAEVVQVAYDSTIISFDDLLEIFWNSHDPTTLNRQGNDIGTQYRSVIFYHNNEQKNIAQVYKEQLNNTKLYPNEIITEISAFDTFYIAENYHQDFFIEHEEEPYCSFIIKPKVEKLKKQFKDKIK